MVGRFSRLTFRCTAVVFLCVWSANVPARQGEAGWEALPDILARIVPPEFPDRTLCITDFGARGDSTTDCTAAIREAITMCAMAGGGHVTVPPGVYRTGPIHLKSNVNLHVSEGATVLFSTEPVCYAGLVLTRWEGVECINYSPLIYALDQENIAITGAGVLDGQASKDTWWSWKGSREYGWNDGMPDQ